MLAENTERAASPTNDPVCYLRTTDNQDFFARDRGACPEGNSRSRVDHITWPLPGRCVFQQKRLRASLYGGEQQLAVIKRREKDNRRADPALA